MTKFRQVIKIISEFITRLSVAHIIIFHHNPRIHSCICLISVGVRIFRPIKNHSFACAATHEEPFTLPRYLWNRASVKCCFTGRKVFRGCFVSGVKWCSRALFVCRQPEFRRVRCFKLLPKLCCDIPQSVACFLLGNSPGNYPAESMQHSEHDESLKSRIHQSVRDCVEIGSTSRK